MKMNVMFHRKEVKFETAECKIEKVVELKEDEYIQFRNNMLRDYDFIADNTDKMYIDKEGVTHCLLVLGEDQNDGIAINSSGYSYARYSALVPNARDCIQFRVISLADDIVRLINQATDIDEVREQYDITITFPSEFGDLLLHELQKRPQINNVSINDGCFKIEINPGCYLQRENETPRLCNLLCVKWENVHLCSSEEEHELATIVELSENTLTQAGQKEWTDVLSAKVSRIYQGYYGLQMELSNVRPDRLEAFSYMLAGYCSSENYAKWVNENVRSDEESMSMQKGME